MPSETAAAGIYRLGELHEHPCKAREHRGTFPKLRASKHMKG